MLSKCNTLFVFEGGSTEDKIEVKLANHFMHQSIAVKSVYGGEIYQLYRRMAKDDFAVDIVTILKERKENEKILEGYDSDDFAYIYLFFDYDGHATKADDEQVKKLIEYFNNETEEGKLFISYPMVEAIRHYKGKEEFKDLTAKCKGENCPKLENCSQKEECLKEPHYKKYSPKESIPPFPNLNTTEIWQELIDAHLCKANYVVNNIYDRPVVLINQADILSGQIEKYVSQPCPLVAVLSAFPMFVQDYYGLDGLNKKL